MALGELCHPADDDHLSTKGTKYRSYNARLAGRRIPRGEVLVTFLAILELARLGQLTAWQQGGRGEIFLLPRLEGDAAANGGGQAAPASN